MRFPKTSLAVALIAATLVMPAVAAAPDMHKDHAAVHKGGGMDHHGMRRHGWGHRHGWHRHCWTRWHHHHAVRVCR